MDNQNIIGLVSMDLSEAFDTLPHDLIVEKFRAYGADDNTELIKDYLTNRRQRVRLGDSILKLARNFSRNSTRKRPRSFDIQHIHERPRPRHQTQQFVCLCGRHADILCQQRVRKN